MSRTQTIVGLGDVSLTGTYQKVYATSLFLKSFTIQAAKGNAGIVSIADSLGTTLLELAPGIGCTELGDNMDNGTASKVDISTIQAKSTNVGDIIHVTAVEGL